MDILLPYNIFMKYLGGVMRLVLCFVVMVSWILLWGYEASYIDSTVQPADDFYRYANGSWIKSNVLPQNISRYNQLSETDHLMLQNLAMLFANNRCETATCYESDAPLERIAALLQIYYNTGVCEKGDYSRERAVLLEQMESIQSQVMRGMAADAIAELHLLGVNPLFRIYDPEAWQVLDIHRLYLRQPSINIMPHEDDESIRFNAQYRDYLVELFTLCGNNAEAIAVSRADAAIRVEFEIASILRPDPQSPRKMYNKRSPGEFASWFEPMDFNIWLQELSIGNEEELVIDHPDYFQDLAELLQNINHDDLSCYLTSKFLTAYGRYMHGDFQTARAEYFRKQYGLNLLDSVGSSVVEQMTYDLPEYLNEFYLDKFITEDVVAGVHEIAENVRTAWMTRVGKNDWMGSSERQRAMQKLASLEFVIGGESFADSVSAYSLTDEILKTDPEITYIEVAMSVRKWRTHKTISRIGQVWDETRPEFWSFSLNFYYSLLENRVIIGGGNLIAPSFDLYESPSASYGGIGTRIGHEVSHAIDSQGRLFHANGKPLNWFQRLGLTSRFDTRCKTLIDQYNHYFISEDCSVDGKATLMENLADLGGVITAYDALTLACTNRRGSSPPDARVFLIAYAQKWRELITERQQRLQCKGPHSPTCFRAIGPLQNIDLFYDTFVVPPDSPMYLEPEKRTHLW